MNHDENACVYGAPPVELATVPTGARQLSPLIPGSGDLDAVAPGSLDAMVVSAPPGTIERRYVLAQALRALRPGGRLTALAPKDKGGSRLGNELTAFGAPPTETARRHHRICDLRRPEMLDGVEAAIAEGSRRQLGGLWTQPGVFSWDRLDPGSQLLIQTLPPLAGEGADLGAGLGLLALKVLESPKVTGLDLVELDRRAIEAARLNVGDPRARFHWGDVRTAPALEGLDFVVSNPPFHASGAEDRGLGQAFIRRAHAALRKGGAFWIVANRHLPYEAVLNELFASLTMRADAGGFKVYEARR